jgi:hypothetical protein
VAVRRSLGDRVGTGHAARAGAVFDDHGLLQALGKLLGNEPAGGIDATARADRHDDGDLTLRTELRLRRNSRQTQHRSGKPDTASPNHNLLLPSFFYSLQQA